MTYEYRCRSCGHEWEQEQKITDPPASVCPACGEGAAVRLISSAPAVILKGGGWAEDGYDR